MNVLWNLCKFEAAWSSLSLKAIDYRGCEWELSSGNNPNICQLIDKIRYVHTVEYYSAITRNKVLIHAMIFYAYRKEVNHKQPYIIWFHSYEMFRIGKSIKTEGRLVVVRDWRGRGREMTANGVRISFWSD